MYQCISVSHVDPAKVERILEAARVLAKETRSQHGNLSYNVVKPEGRDDNLIVTERWETKEDFLGHVANADKEGDMVFEFGKLMGECSIAEAELYPSEVLI